MIIGPPHPPDLTARIGQEETNKRGRLKNFRHTGLLAMVLKLFSGLCCIE